MITRNEKPNMNSFDIEKPPETKHELEIGSQESPSSPPPPPKNCLSSMWHYGGIPEAKAYALLAMGRGVGVMSNVVVNAALLELAMAAAGCPTGKELDALESDFKCTNKIYGQNPLSLISNIAVVSGLLGAFFMPIIGVILDFTPFRRFVGILFSFIFALIQGAQIGIGSETWFPMAILQAIAGFCFTIMMMTTFAYLPEICEEVGQTKHGVYTARFTAKQFSAQASFLLLLGGFSLSLHYDSIRTARLSQAMNLGIITILFGMGWHVMPSRPASRDIPQGKQCLIIYGFRQNFRTVVSIHRDYKKGLRWYLLATVFAQSSVGALTTVSVVYLSSEVGLNASDISLFFFVVLVGTLPGAKFSSVILKRINPNTSWQLSMISLFVVMVAGAFTLGGAANKYYSLIWGFFMGTVLGWFYPTENLFFSCVLPKGQEAEISGFRVYCSVILSWMPPMLFSILIENGVDAKWGMTFMGSFILVAASLLKFGAGTWEEILQESQRSELTEHEANVELQSRQL